MKNSSLPNTYAPTLVIFCKRPKLGQGKSRIAHTLGIDNAFALAKAMFNCALEDAQDWRGKVVLAISSDDDMLWAQSQLGPKGQVILQGQGNLGQRINHIDRCLRAKNHRQMVYIGTDAPCLQRQHYHDICQQLEQSDYAFSRALDGGVTIMANSMPWPDLTHLPWSTDTLGLSLIESCKAKGKVGFIDPSYDIDHESDLNRLVSDLVHEPRSARQALVKQVNQLDIKSVKKPSLIKHTS